MATYIFTRPLLCYAAEESAGWKHCHCHMAEQLREQLQCSRIQHTPTPSPSHPHPPPPPHPSPILYSSTVVVHTLACCAGILEQKLLPLRLRPLYPSDLAPSTPPTRHPLILPPLILPLWLLPLASTPLTPPPLPLRLGYAAPSERSCALLRSILLSYAAPYWATPHPKKILSPVYLASLILPTKLMIYRETLQNIPHWQTNPPKYTTAYIVQQSNCRWHCEPTFFFLVRIKQWKVYSPFTPLTWPQVKKLTLPLLVSSD